MKLKEKLLKNKPLIKNILTFVFIFSFIAYLYFVMRITLFKYVRPWEVFNDNRDFTQGLNLVLFSGGEVKRSVILNSFMYFPFGFMLQMVSKSKKQSVAFCVIPFLFSILMEVVQYVFYLGITDITDVFSNTLGAIIGIVTYAIFAKAFAKKKEKMDYTLRILIFITAIIILIMPTSYIGMNLLVFLLALIIYIPLYYKKRNSI